MWSDSDSDSSDGSYAGSTHTGNFSVSNNKCQAMVTPTRSRGRVPTKKPHRKWMQNVHFKCTVKEDHILMQCFDATSIIFELNGCVYCAFFTLSFGKLSGI
jgi:hypothetical protein